MSKKTDYGVFGYDGELLGLDQQCRRREEEEEECWLESQVAMKKPRHNIPTKIGR